MTRTEFNNNFMIRWYPNLDYPQCHMLIGFGRMKGIVDNGMVFQSILNRAKAHKGDEFTHVLRRGMQFKIIGR